MKPSEISGRLTVLNADLELSGRSAEAHLCAQAAAYLVEFEGIVQKLDMCDARTSVFQAAINRLQDQLEHAEARALALEAEVLYYKAKETGR